jgi:hypothetical protein
LLIDLEESVFGPILVFDGLLHVELPLSDARPAPLVPLVQQARAMADDGPLYLGFDLSTQQLKGWWTAPSNLHGQPH